MDREFLNRNKPGTDRPQEVAGAPPGEGAAELDPVRIWTPQPGDVYGTLDRAADEGNLPLGDSAISRADAGMTANAAPDETQQGHPFRAAEHGFEDTTGGVRTDLDFGIGLRSGQGQSEPVGEPEKALEMPPNISIKPAEQQGT